MRIGVFADAHDHIDNVRRAVIEFNRRGCGLVIFAGLAAGQPVGAPVTALVPWQ